MMRTWIAVGLSLCLWACGGGEGADATEPGSGSDAGIGADNAMGSDTSGERDASVGPGTPSGSAPSLVLDAPVGAWMSPRPDVLLQGVAFDDAPLEVVRVAHEGGETTLAIDVGGAFSGRVPLVPGSNRLMLSVRDEEGQQDSVELEVYFGHRLSVGNSQGVLLVEDEIYTWERNELGQLGNGTLEGSGYGEDPETSQWPARYQFPRRGIVSVVTRQTFMIALDEAGQIVTWGSNSDGQLGYSAEQDCGVGADSPCRRIPTLVPGVSGAIAVQAGFRHSMVLLEDGTVLTWGANDAGQLGHAGQSGQMEPSPVSGLTEVVQLAASSDSSFALTAQGHVFAWGENNKGQLGLGFADAQPHPTPARIESLQGVVEIAAGTRNGYALREDGTVWGWGQNHAGQVGAGDGGEDVLAPVQVMTRVQGDALVPLTGVVHLAADGFVAMALHEDGRVLMWGLGALGQLGQGNLSDGERDLGDRAWASPVALSAQELEEFVIQEIEVGAGGPAMALTASGDVLGWGWSFRGSMGLEGALDAWAYSVPIVLFSQP